MDKRFLVILAIVILGLVGLFVFTKQKSVAPSSPANTSVSASNHIEGKADSKVKLLVYGDFQCSACEQFYPIEKQVVDKYSNQISFQFRHFPLENLHPNARAASRAAEAAGLQGKFFEMHNMLYQSQAAWRDQSVPLNVFISFANSLNLDVNKFKTDYASENVNAIINADYQAGSKLGVAGTPSYYLNGKLLDNKDIGTVEQFSAKIDATIKQTGN